MIKYCSKCKEDNRKECPSGYSFWWKDNVYECPYDKNELHDISFSADDLAIISAVSEDTAFIEAMIKLRQDDIIEYESRMSQFRTQVQQQEQAKKATEEKSKPHCPTCGSTNITKISGTSKAASVALWGIFSQKVKKQWHCNSCKYEW